MVDWNKNNILKIAGVFVFIILLGVYMYGIPVPVESPYVQLEIASEKIFFNVGDTVFQQYLIRNQMPFPIRINLTKDNEIISYQLENITEKRC